jgi:hypothetical protein
VSPDSRRAAGRASQRDCRVSRAAGTAGSTDADRTANPAVDPSAAPNPRQSATPESHDLERDAASSATSSSARDSQAADPHGRAALVRRGGALVTTGARLHVDAVESKLRWRPPAPAAGLNGAGGPGGPTAPTGPVERFVARRPKRRLFGPVSVPLVLFVLMFALGFAHQGRLVEYAYPALSLVIALWLYRWYPAHYLGFVCWVFFLTPEIRRIGDYYAGGFNPVSLTMTAPLIVSAISGFALLSNFSMLGQRRAAPLVLVMLGLLYAYLIGVTRAGIPAATFAAVGSMLPALIGFRLVATWEEHPNYQRVLLKTFVWGGALMGAYGIYEFVSPLPWDAYWLLASGMHSEGDAVPFMMRVSSTMNSSGPFANTAMICLLMALAARGWQRVAAGLALPALMFTSVRSAWGGLLVGLIYPVAMLDLKSRIRLFASVFGLVVLCTPVLFFNEITDHFTKRLETVQNLNDDNSFQARADFYSGFLSTALTDITGQGFGTTGLASKLADNASQTIGVFDSGLMEVPYEMGWPGSLLYVSGVFLALARAFTATRRNPEDRFGMSGVGSAFAVLAMMVFSNTLVSATGMFFFICVVMPVNALRYSRERGVNAANGTNSVKGASGAARGPAARHPQTPQHPQQTSQPTTAMTVVTHRHGAAATRTMPRTTHTQPTI